MYLSSLIKFEVKKAVAQANMYDFLEINMAERKFR